MKDPASIAWLRGRTAAGHTDQFYERWLPAWSRSGNRYGAWDWLEGRERWIAFLIETFERESREERRIQLLDVLVELDNASVDRFFETLRHRTSGHRETLVVEEISGKAQ